METEREIEILQAAYDLVIEQNARQTEYLKNDPAFSLIADIESKGALTELRKRLSDSKLRRSQLALSPQRDWIAPVKPMKPKDADKNLSQKLVIDPSRVPLALATVFSGRKTIPKNETDRTALQTEAIPLLLKALESARPLNVGPRHLPFHKILILEEPAGFKGKLLVFPRDPQNEVLYSIEIVEDLHSLIRQYHHILQGYKADPFTDIESPKKMTLREKELHLEDQITSLHGYVLKNRAVLRQDPKLLEKYRERGMALAGAYEKVRNPHKRKAVDRVASAAIPEDSLGRLNLPAKILQLIGALNDLDKRTGETGGIDSTMSEQNKEISEVLWRCTGSFRRYNKLFRMNPALRKGFESSQEVHGFLNLLSEEGIDPDLLARPDRFSFQPFRSYKDHLVPLNQVLQSTEYPGFISDANQALLGIYLLTKLWHYHNHLEGLLFDLNVRGETFKPSMAHQNLSEMLQTFSEAKRKVMPQEHFSEFDEVYAKVQAIFQFLKNRLQGRETLTVKERLELSNEIKALNLSAEVQALAIPHSPVEFAMRTTQKQVQSTLNPSGGTEASS